jgi:hypothetical protein
MSAPKATVHITEAKPPGPAGAPAPRRRAGSPRPPESFNSMAMDLADEVGQVRAIAYTLYDLEYQYYPCWSKDHLEWLKSVLLNSLRDKCDGLSRSMKHFETRLKGSA